jgi:hypothetical protein
VNPAIQNNLQAKLDFMIDYKCPANLEVCIISIQCYSADILWAETTFQYDVGRTSMVESFIRKLQDGATVMVSMQSRLVGNATHSATMNNS